jgi:thiamine-monophosphate kinase
LGEFGLIERMRGLLPAASPAELLVGIGDDAAVWQAGDRYVIATTDTLVEGVHFLPGRASWRDVGWKALAVNVSDIAAMGGGPEFALVTLCLPPATQVRDLDELYAGLGECAEAYGVTIAGGDIVRAEEFAVTVALYGYASVASGGAPLLLRRAAARAADLVAVTAPLGGSAAGFRVLQTSGADNDEQRALVDAHMHPWPRVDAGQIAVAAGIRCGIDISDGLVQDLGQICRASGVDAEIEAARVPIDEATQAVFPDDARLLALTGGEDYELLLVGGAAELELANGALERHLRTGMRELHIIGRITGAGNGRVRVLDERGAEIELRSGGWDHLRSRA